MYQNLKLCTKLLSWRWGGMDPNIKNPNLFHCKTFLDRKARNKPILKKTNWKLKKQT